MEDILPLLFGLAWIIISAYRNNQKQKKAQDRPQPSESTPQPPVDEVPEWLRRLAEKMDGNLTPAPEPVVVTPTPKPVQPVKKKPKAPSSFLNVDRKVSGAGMSAYRMSESEEGVRSTTPNTSTPNVLQTAFEGPSMGGEMFDLRQALVLSAIIQRPYN